MKLSIFPPFSLRFSDSAQKRYSVSLCEKIYRFFITPQARVLQVGCSKGIFLSALKPSYGALLEHDEQKVQSCDEQLGDYQWIKSVSELSHQAFDYIIVSAADESIGTLDTLLQELKSFCHPRTRLIVESNAGFVNFVRWFCKLLFKKPSAAGYQQYLSSKDLMHSLYLADYEVIRHEKNIVFPWYIPGVSWIGNTIIPVLPLFSSLCFKRFIIARPLLPQTQLPSVSVIIPCKNEEGNIERAVKELPNLGSHTEIIFVEGNSRDNTVQEIERVKAQYAHKDIKFFKQQGKGKGDAVRLGFEKAQGDILMISDADLTVEPQELVHFYQVLYEGKAEFANGSRLVYPMEHEAMPFLNTLVNYSFGCILSWILGQRLKDTLCGTKALYKKDYLLIVHNRSFFGELDPFGDFDLLFGAAKLLLKMCDIPVHYKSRRYGSSQIGGYFFNGLLLLRMCWPAFKRLKLRLF